MNPSNFISDYNLGSMPTPPWKTNISSNISSNASTFPIPPRNNDLGITPKSTNYEWKKAGTAFPGDVSNSQSGNLGFPGQGGVGVGGGGFSGSDFNRLGNQGFQSSANSGAGIGSGGTLFGGTGNVSDYRNNADSSFDVNFRSGFGTNTFKDKIVYHNQAGGRLGDKSQGGVQDHNNSIDNNCDSNTRDHFDAGRNFERNDNFNRGNTVSNNLNNVSSNDRPGNFNQTSDRGNNSDNGSKSSLGGSNNVPWKGSNSNNNRNTSTDYRNNQNRRQSSPRRFERNDKSANNNNNDQDSFRRRSMRNQSTASQPKPNATPTKAPLKNPIKVEDLELEKKALATDVSQDFFAKIKPLSLMQVAADVALRYARQEYYLTILNRKTCPEKPSGSGQYTCKTCYMNFLTKEKLNTHNNGVQHKELEDLFRIKKEQARLIMEKKITGPTPPKLLMKPLSEAEEENNLKSTELELDVYILGIYESVMKPYWPVPQSKYYCRICNYLEFSVEADFRRHNNTNDHKKREATYEEAFCLYCQRHYNDKAQLDTHVTTSKHIQIKDLMERTKECAVEHWHKANDVPRIVEKSDTPKVSDLNEVSKDNKDTPKVGSKRSASDDGNKSPLKKSSTGKSDVSSSKSLRSSSNTDSSSKSETRKSDREKTESKASDKKSTSKSDVKSTPKSDGKPASKSDVKPSPKSDSRPASKSDAKPAPKSDTKDGSKSDSKSDGLKGESKTDSKSDMKGGSKSDSKSEIKTKELSEKEKIWFAPVTGWICIVCHDFIKDEAEQKVHASLSKHIDNIKKFTSLVS